MNEIFNRVSIRNFKPQEVTNENIELILKAGMQAPSAGNQQPWEFIVIRDKETLSKLSEVNIYSKSIKNASVAILVLGNRDFMRFEDHYIQDLSACTQNMLLQATNLSLGSVWITIYPQSESADIIKNMFDLPDTVYSFAILPIGYPEKEREAQDRYKPSRVYFEKYEINRQKS